MFRKTLTMFTLLGLLLSAGLWGVSYYGVAYARAHFPSSTSYILLNGFLQINYFESRSQEVTWSHGAPIRQLSENWSFSWWLPTWRRTGRLQSGRGFSVSVIPLWEPTLLFGLGFAVSYHPYCRRRKRKKLGQCLKCGYDLRGSEERCPECGARFEKPKLNADC